MKKKITTPRKLLYGEFELSKVSLNTKLIKLVNACLIETTSNGAELARFELDSEAFPDLNHVSSGWKFEKKYTVSWILIKWNLADLHSEYN